MDRPQRNVKKACVACNRRKVKCNGEQSCQQCTHLNLRCVYSDDQSSRSRKAIVRGHVIESIKTPARSALRSNPAPLRPAHADTSSVQHEESQSSGSWSFDADFFYELVPDYAANVFPFLPVITEPEFRSAIGRLDNSSHDRAFVYALAAMTIQTSRMGPKYPPSNADKFKALYKAALGLRVPVMPEHRVTVQSIMIPIIGSICLLAYHSNVEMGFYYLREAIAMVQLLGVDKVERMMLLDRRERAQQERLYWVLFVHERFVAISSYQPIILVPLDNLPEREASIPLGVLAGCHHIIRLFRVIDADFIGSWLDKRSSSITFEWIESKQAELADEMYPWEDEINSLNVRQQVDLIVTRYWLRTLVWQIALSKLLLASGVEREREPMSIFFPIRLSARLRSLLATIPREDVEIHGTGILQKIFDITDTIANILIHASAAAAAAGNENINSEIRADHLDNFLFLYRFLLSMSKFYHVEKVLLQTKFATLRSLYPSLSDDSVETLT